MVDKRGTRNFVKRSGIKHTQVPLVAVARRSSGSHRRGGRANPVRPAGKFCSPKSVALDKIHIPALRAINAGMCFPFSVILAGRFSESESVFRSQLGGGVNRCVTGQPATQRTHPEPGRTKDDARSPLRPNRSARRKLNSSYPFHQRQRGPSSSSSESKDISRTRRFNVRQC